MVLGAGCWVGFFGSGFERRSRFDCRSAFWVRLRSAFDSVLLSTAAPGSGAKLLGSISTCGASPSLRRRAQCQARYSAGRSRSRSVDAVCDRSPTTMNSQLRSQNRTPVRAHAHGLSRFLRGRAIQFGEDRCKFFARRVDLFFTARDVAVTLFPASDISL